MIYRQCLVTARLCYFMLEAGLASVYDRLVCKCHAHASSIIHWAVTQCCTYTMLYIHRAVHAWCKVSKPGVL